MNNRMLLRRPPRTLQPAIRLSIVTGAVLAIWVLYIGMEVLIYTGRLQRPLSAAVEFVPGLLGLAVLFVAGFTIPDVYLQVKPLSRKGALALLVTLPLVLAVYLTGAWVGGNAANLLVYGAAGALSQVLFFRCVLLPVSLRVLRGRPLLAIFLAALLHGLWHVGPIAQGYPLVNALPVMLVPFLAGLAWNWQVQHDRTILWASILHILVDQGILLFEWG